MKTKMFSIYDSAVQCFVRPFHAHTEQEAKRMLVSSMTEDSQLTKNPQDFSLWIVGEFNDSDGVITPHLPPTMICTVVGLRYAENLVKPLNDDAKDDSQE